MPNEKAAAPEGLGVWINNKVAAGKLALAQNEAPKGSQLMVDLSLLDDNPFQPRGDIDPEKLAELASSIFDHGLLQSITVRRVGARYQIIAGHRRTAAFRKLFEEAKSEADKARFSTIPAQERVEVRDEQMALYALVENLQRDDLSPVEAAAGLAKYMEMESLSQAQLAERTGVDAQRVKRLLRLHGAPGAIKDCVTKGIMVPVLDEHGEPVVSEAGKPKREHRSLELMPALEFVRLYEHLKRTVPKKASERTQSALQKALTEGWGFRKIQDYCQAIIAGAAPTKASEEGSEGVASSSPTPTPFKRSEKQLVVFFDRIQQADDKQRADLRRTLTEVLESLSVRVNVDPN